MKLTIVLIFAAASFLNSCSNVPKKQQTKTQPNELPKFSDTIKSMLDKKFNDPDNTAVFTTKFVITDNKEITEVHHDKEDGDWQFFSNDKFDDYRKVVMVVGLGQITKRDTTLFELADMPAGFFAHRKFKGDKWIVEQEKQFIKIYDEKTLIDEQTGNVAFISDTEGNTIRLHSNK